MNEKQVPLSKIVRFAGDTNHSTREAMPTLAAQGWVLFPSQIAEGDTTTKALMTLVFGEETSEETKKRFVELVRTQEPDVYLVSTSIVSFGLRDAIEVVQDERGIALVDGCVRFVGVTIQNVLAEQSGQEAKWTITAKVVTETETDQHEDISWTKNSARIELRQSDIGRRALELHLVKNSDGKKKWTQEQIAERLGYDGRQRRLYVRQCRMIVQWCLDNSKPDLLPKWDAGEVSTQAMLDKIKPKDKTADKSNGKANGNHKDKTDDKIDDAEPKDESPTCPPEKDEAQPTKGESHSVGDPETVPDEEEKNREEGRRYSLTAIIMLSPKIDANELEVLLKTDQVHWDLQNGNGRSIGSITVESVEDLHRA